MQNDNKKSDEGQIKPIKTLEKPEAGAKTIFSEEEIKTTVKGFVLAWLRGQIKIKFPIAEELIARAKLERQKLNYDEASQQEVRGKTIFMDEISICSGSKPATLEEQQKAFSNLFYSILSFRAGNRIEGTFTDYSIEERINRLEEGLSITNNLIEAIVTWIRTGILP